MDAPEITVRPLSPIDSVVVESFILRHPSHGPGHRLALARIDAALGCTELSFIALMGDRVVGYAPARAVRTKVLRVIPTTSVSGGGLVACGPLVEPTLRKAQQAEVFAALAAAVREAARREGAAWLRWVHPPVLGTLPTLEALDPRQLLAAGFDLRLLPGLLVDLRASEDELLAGLNATNRRRIQRAEQSGLVSTELEGSAAADALQPLRQHASAAFGAHPNADQAFSTLLTLLGETGGEQTEHAVSPLASSTPPALLRLLCVRHATNGGTLGAVVTCESNGLAYYFLAFNSADGLAQGASPVGLWRAMLASKARGNRWFLLGSLEYGESKSARISAFKRQFGGATVMAPVAEWCARPLTVAALQLVTRGVAALRSSRRG
jgi:hypothetical protein